MSGKGVRYNVVTMLQLSESLKNRAVLSLRTGGVIGHTLTPIINPNNLKIEGFFCQDRFSKDRLVLLTQDIRDQPARGYIVNDHDVLSDPKDLVRLQEILKLNFELSEKPVFTSAKKRLGRVTDYALDNQTMYIQKLYVGQNLLKSFSGGQLSIDRSQIVEITPRRIIVNDPLQGKPSAVGAPVPAS